jgi:hypothetical protein
MPMSFHEFLPCGGMEKLERKAADDAIEIERRIWLPIIEHWAADEGDDGLDWPPRRTRQRKGCRARE